MNQLDQIASQISQDKRPPVHLWNPDSCGDIDIRIDASGRWWHEGEVIQRAALVRLFASILWSEGDTYYLVTPVEKLRIMVEDVPFVVRSVERVEDHWVATTNTLETIIVGNDSPVMLRPYGDNAQWIPYLRIRYELWARLDRGAYYDWVSAAMDAQDLSNDPASAAENASLRSPQGLFLNSGEYRFEVARV